MGIVFVNTKGRGAIEKRQNIHLYNNLFWVETSQQAKERKQLLGRDNKHGQWPYISLIAAGCLLPDYT